MLKINFQITKQLCLAICLVFSGISANAQVNNVGIGTTTPDPSAILELQATDQGFLPPRMDQSGENALSNPAPGLMIYNTNVNNGGTPRLRFFDGTLWNSSLSQKSNGEVFLDNLTSNYFNIPNGANYQFQIASTPVLKLNSSGNDQHVLINDNTISTYNTAGSQTNLSLQGYATFQANGNVRFNQPGGDRNIWITDGQTVECFRNDNATREDLYLNGSFRVQGNGNMRHHITGQDRNMYFIDGEKIEVAANDGGSRDLLLQWNGGETRVGRRLQVNHMDVWDGDNDYDMTWGGGDWLTIEGSSRKYKENIEIAQIDFRRILDLEVKQYTMKEGHGKPGLKILGVIAEEADSLGLNHLVVYHKKTQEPDAVKYKKIGLYLLPIVQEQDRMLKEQQKQIDDLEARLKRLEGIISERD